MRRLSMFFVVLCLPLAVKAADTQSAVVSEFSVIQEKVKEILKGKANAKDLLVVFDIDNTMLKTKTDLASEQWFLWQKKLIEEGLRQSPAVANSVDGLLQLQGRLYAMGSMSLVSPEIPSFITDIKTRGGAVIALTSRNITMRDATLRELEANGISLSSSTDLGLKWALTPVQPFRVDQPLRSGLSRADVSIFRPLGTRAVVFDSGAYLTQGQHKGVVLKALLYHSQRKFKDIVFIDDREYHIEGMRKVFGPVKERMHSFQFVRAKEWIEAFDKGDKKVVEAEWCALSRGLKNSLYKESIKADFNACPP